MSVLLLLLMEVLIDDYAFLINGLLDLHEYGGLRGLLSFKPFRHGTLLVLSIPFCILHLLFCSWAYCRHLQDEFFLDKQGGIISILLEKILLFFCVLKKIMMAQSLLVSGNSVVAINLIRLSRIFDAAKSDKRTVQHFSVRVTFF
ncbi:hypothetical protein ABZP36_009482 [Zizania latifolia]